MTAAERQTNMNQIYTTKSQIVRNTNPHARSYGISAQSVGSQNIYMHLSPIPPGIRTMPHKHDYETAAYVISGQVELWSGENLEDHLLVNAGEFVYIPAGMPHVVGNPSQTDFGVAVLARDYADEEEVEEMLPALNTLVN
jgi:uncharacterized RmlC-like cupin family protein